MSARKSSYRIDAARRPTGTAPRPSWSLCRLASRRAVSSVHISQRSEARLTRSRHSSHLGRGARAHAGASLASRRSARFARSVSPTACARRAAFGGRFCAALARPRCATLRVQSRASIATASRVNPAASVVGHAGLAASAALPAGTSSVAAARYLRGLPPAVPLRRAAARKAGVLRAAMRLTRRATFCARVPAFPPLLCCSRVHMS